MALLVFFASFVFKFEWMSVQLSVAEVDRNGGENATVI